VTNFDFLNDAQRKRLHEMYDEHDGKFIDQPIVGFLARKDGRTSDNMFVHKTYFDRHGHDMTTEWPLHTYVPTYALGIGTPPVPTLRSTWPKP
jgi:hypothetical protein